MNDIVHVFAGKFASIKEACQYTQEQWEPEPDESVSDEEYEEWEERNPIWLLERDLNEYLDSNFIETIDGEDRYSYLEGLLINKDEISEIQEKIPSNANILVLIFKEALGDFPSKLKSTSKLFYCGEYACKL